MRQPSLNETRLDAHLRRRNNNIMHEMRNIRKKVIREAVFAADEHEYHVAAMLRKTTSIKPAWQIASIRKHGERYFTRANDIGKQLEDIKKGRRNITTP